MVFGAWRCIREFYEKSIIRIETECRSNLGVNYHNKYMYGNIIKMTNPLTDGLIEYNDGTEATEKQMAKDVVTFLA